MLLQALSKDMEMPRRGVPFDLFEMDISLSKSVDKLTAVVAVAVAARTGFKSSKGTATIFCKFP